MGGLLRYNEQLPPPSPSGDPLQNFSCLSGSGPTQQELEHSDPSFLRETKRPALSARAFYHSYWGLTV